MDYALIGGGNMGRAIAFALVDKRVCPPEALLVIEPDPRARRQLEPLGCALAEAPEARLGEAAVAVLAVKPQVADAVMATVQPWLRPAQVVLSIMAGVTLERLQSGLGHEAVVRAMPNTPAQIGLGMSAYFPAPAVPAEGLRRTEALLTACGEALRVADEDKIDAATAVSGSGPAYLFYVAEHWIGAAEALGFSPADAERLVHQTVTGAAALWKRSELPVATLREQVTSKGGTTAAALERFGEAGVDVGLREGIERAYRRAKELAGG